MKTIQFPSLASAFLAVILSTVTADDTYTQSSYGYSTVEGENAYADTSSTYYNGYAQAWRFLGYFVECNGGSNRYWKQSGSHSHSGSGDDTTYGNNFCQRYLMWAAVSLAITRC